jgi:anaerobic selenocysteine-containing dehydrogenase
MFDSDLNDDAAQQKMTRRAFLVSCSAAAAAIAAWSVHAVRAPLDTTVPSGPAPVVEIAEFSSAGVPTGSVRCGLAAAAFGKCLRHRPQGRY